MPEFIKIDVQDLRLSEKWRLPVDDAVTEVVATLSPKLPREPRILVPVDVQAFFVPAAGGDTRADVRSRALDDTGHGVRMPPPFTDQDSLPPGVHLHWALPDGLTRAQADREDQADDDLGFRPLPNRWLVIRLDPTTAASKRRPVRAWVVLSEQQRSVDLDAFDADEAPVDGPATVDPAVFTAVTGAEFGWAAAYDNVVDRLGFHDDLAGVRGAKTLAYVVVGWYSKPDLDPLHPSNLPDGFARGLQALGWDVDLSSLGAAIEVSATTIDQIQTAAEKAFEKKTDAGGFSIIRDERAGFGARDLVADQGVDHVIIKRPPRPRQSLYHGTIYGVRVGRATATPDPRPSPAAITMAVAPTPSDAVAKLLAPDDRDQERLMAAFGHRLMDEYLSSTGWSQIDGLVHQRSFSAFADPAGPIIERVKAPDPPSDRRSPPDPAGSFDKIDKVRVGTFDGIGLRLSFTKGRYTAAEEILAEARNRQFDLQTRIGGFTEIRRPRPRFWFPGDPSVVIKGLARSLRHGYDGRFVPGETLACRLSSQPVRGYRDLLTGRDAVDTIAHGGVPSEVNQLLTEAALGDPDHVDHLVARAVRKGGVRTVEVSRRIQAEITLNTHLQASAHPPIELLEASLAEGVWPSAVGVTYWRQAWVPLYLEWEIALETTDRINGWHLGEVDHDLDVDGDPDAAPALVARTMQGRTLLAGSGANGLSDALDTFLAQESARDDRGEGAVPPSVQNDLVSLATDARRADVLTGALSGMNDQLLGFDPDTMAPVGDELAPTTEPQLLRAGFFRFVHVRVVDAFGRTISLDDRAQAALIGEEYENPAASTPARLHVSPRLTSPSRLLLRFVDAADDTAEARVDEETPLLERNPIAGFLLPDHADDALEFFDPTGTPMGQLFHRGARTEVTWEGVPGRPGPMGAPPVVPPGAPGAAHVAAIAAALERRDVVDRAAATDSGAEGPGESALSALLRTIDTTTWTVDPLGSTGLEHTSTLTGRPIAVVRASLRLDIFDDSGESGLSPDAQAQRHARFEEMADRTFEVRLGSLTRFDDGLLGYFVGDDYSVFHPVHALVRDEARPGGPAQGFLAGTADAAAFGADLPVEPITHPMIAEAASVVIHPGQVVHLTLLMHPGLGVHATAGVVPRKRLELARAWIAEPLARILPSFRVGPVLVDPDTIRMPKITVLGDSQDFTRRDTPTTWRDDPILAATMTARLSDTPVTAQEGWVRVHVEEHS